MKEFLMSLNAFSQCYFHLNIIHKIESFQYSEKLRT